MSKYLLVVGLIINSNLFSQNSLINFLETSENSKIGALGGNNVSLNEKNNYFLSNPAFTYKSNKVVSINYLNYISDINSSSILFTDSSSFLGNFGIGVKYFSYRLVSKNDFIYHAGTELVDNKVYAIGGRVLNFVSISDDLKKSRETVINKIKN